MFRSASLRWPGLLPHAVHGGVLALLLVAALAIPAPGAAASLRYDWQDRFERDDRLRLQRWIDATQAGLERLVGPLDLELRVQMRRHDRAREPVPWAQTLRARPQGVRFHVDPAYPDSAFYSDWTAAHELSHLVLPYLGDGGSWFSEGFASYMQYQVLAEMGALEHADPMPIYRRHLDAARAGYPYGEQPFAHAAASLRRAGRYSVMYWGGAVYFLRVDAALRERHRTLVDVLREYLACCRRDHDRLDDLVARLDGLTGDRLFSRELQRMRSEPGFPRWPER